MLKIVVSKRELYDEASSSFIYLPETTLELEHSLVSVSKWEAKFHKPFLSKDNKTNSEIIEYIKCMCLNNVDPNTFIGLSKNNMEEISKYIEDSMTATWFSDDKNAPKGRSSEQITSELIYYWMVALEIPFECQYWHLNRLLTLIRICNIKGQPPKKMSKTETMARNAALNAQRRKALGTKG